MGRFYYIISALAAIISTGCIENKISDNYDDSTLKGENVIIFSSDVKQTRAVETTLDKLKEYAKINLNAYVEEGGDLLYYFGGVLNYANNKWDSENNHYWPTSDAPLTFYAHSPLQSNIALSESKDKLTYTCPADVDQQVDLLVETLTGQTYTTDDVELNFEHALSSIEFKVKFKGEKNITLNSINISYIGVEREREYNFVDESWIVPDTKSYFNEASGSSTSIPVDSNLTTENPDSNPIEFNNIPNWLMIIPQPISFAKDNQHHLSVQISYSLGSGMSGSSEIVTGYMPLPPVKVDGTLQYEYKKGEIYTYTLLVNDKLIEVEDIKIESAEDPVPAYGNIHLDLIETAMTADEIGYTGSDETAAQVYYTTAKRVKDLLNDGVRDFVVVGSMGANSSAGQNVLGNGKLGYYGTSSPFYIGGVLAGYGKNITPDELISVDLRGTHHYPRFADANNDTSKPKAAARTRAATEDNDRSVIGDDEPILIAGLFAYIDWLDEVMLPHGIAAIGNHAFDSCDALRSIDIADIEHIELGAFQKSKKLKTVKNGYITRIHENGFDECISLTTIDLSHTIQIGESGFVNCRELTNVDLSSLNIVGTYAFSGCKKLTLDPTANNYPRLTYVADYAFEGCELLCQNKQKINLTDATFVGDHAFNECTELLLSDGNLDDLATIENGAFANCRHLGTSYPVHLPVVNKIGVSAFENCEKINIVEGLERLTEISPMAFKGCTKLTGYPEGESVLTLPNVTTVGMYGFCKSGVTNIDFGSPLLTEIGEHSFNGCKSLTTITGLGNITKVGDYAFSSCTSLTEINLPKLKECGGEFFYNCQGLKRLSLPLITKNTIHWQSDDGASQTTSLVSMMINNTSDMGDGSYKNLIEEINLPALVVDFPDAWVGFPNLKSVDLGAATSIGNGCFSNSTQLTHINLSSITSIGASTLQSCSSLEELNLPLLKSWKQYFFSGCTSLKVINMPLVENNVYSWDSVDGNGVKNTNYSYIMDMVAGAAANLVEIRLPLLDAAEIPTWGALGNASNLEIADFASVKAVGNGGLQNCRKLTTLNLASAITVGTYAIQNCTSLTKLNLSSYDSAANVGNIDMFTAVDSENCELWLSDAEVRDYVTSGNVWKGKTWKIIHKASDNYPFE